MTAKPSAGDVLMATKCDPVLETCPLCRTKAGFIETDCPPIGMRYGVACLECDCRCDFREKTKEAAAKKWNWRKIAAPAGADVREALVEIDRVSRWTGTDNIEYQSHEGRIANAALRVSPPSAPAGADAREATGDDKKKGWRLDFKWLVQLQTEVEKATGYGATLEVIEETILRTRATPPSAMLKRPVAFRVAHDGIIFLSSDEAAARQYAEKRDLDYQGLYVRDGSPSVPGVERLREALEKIANQADIPDGFDSETAPVAEYAFDQCRSIARAALIEQPAEKK